jgi:hypothetical protein
MREGSDSHPQWRTVMFMTYFVAKKLQETATGYYTIASEAPS